MLKIYNKIIYWLRLFEKILLISTQKVCINSLYFTFFASSMFSLFICTGMTSAYHLWPVDPIGGGMLLLVMPIIFFLMTVMLVFIGVIVTSRMITLGYCNHEFSIPSIWLVCFLGIAMYVGIICFFIM